MSERREGAEPRHLTPSEQRVMHSALRASVRIIEPPAAPPGLDEAAMVNVVASVLESAPGSDADAEREAIRKRMCRRYAERAIAALRPLLAQREAEAWRKGAEAMREAALSRAVSCPPCAAEVRCMDAPPPPAQGG